MQQYDSAPPRVGKTTGAPPVKKAKAKAKKKPMPKKGRSIMQRVRDEDMDGK